MLKSPKNKNIQSLLSFMQPKIRRSHIYIKKIILARLKELKEEINVGLQSLIEILVSNENVLINKYT